MEKLLRALEQLAQARSRLAYLDSGKFTLLEMADNDIDLAVGLIEEFIREESGVNTHSPVTERLNAAEDLHAAHTAAEKASHGHK